MAHPIRRPPARRRRSVRMTDAEWAVVTAVAVRRATHTSAALRELALDAARRELGVHSTDRSDSEVDR